MNSELQTKTLAVVRWFAVIAVAVLAFRLTWLSDDALITLRTALNITHNWGPGYNATEAVQAYTHPMWFLLWIIIGITTNQWVYGILVAGILLTAAAVGVVVWRTNSIARIVAIVGMLVFSNAFMEYSTSGLENPLSYFAIAVAFTLAISLVSGSFKSWWIKPLLLGLTFAAIFLNRFDLAFLLAPVILLLVFHFRSNIRVLLVASVAFLVPLAIWFSWSWITYNTLLPNTFTAKRNVDIPQLELIVQGLRYMIVSFEHDPVTLILLILGIGAGFALGDRLVKAWTVGVVLYLGYVTWIGGDFMAGRFYAVPALVSALILAVVAVRRDSDTAEKLELLPANTQNRDPVVAPAGAIVFITFLMMGASLSGSTPTAIANPQSQRWEFEQNTNGGIADERGWYVEKDLSIKNPIDKLSLAYVNPDIAPLGDSSGLMRSLREISKAAQNWPVNDGGFSLPSEVGVFCGGVGYLGIATGPITHIIDQCALTDRFLGARAFVPIEPFAWRPGHLGREIPEGYVEAIQTGDPLKVRDTAVAFELGQLWEKIR